MGRAGARTPVWHTHRTSPADGANLLVVIRPEAVPRMSLAAQNGLVRPMATAEATAAVAAAAAAAAAVAEALPAHAVCAEVPRGGLADSGGG